MALFTVVVSKASFLLQTIVVLQLVAQVFPAISLIVKPIGMFSIGVSRTLPHPSHSCLLFTFLSSFLSRGLKALHPLPTGASHQRLSMILMVFEVMNAEINWF